MKANANSPKLLLLAAGVSLIAQSAFGQSPPATPVPAAAPPAKFETTKVPDGVIRSATTFTAMSFW